MQRHRGQGITLGILSIALITMAIALVLALIKIYLSNRIYHESRQVYLLEREVAALEEENTLLHMRVEKLQYKSQIADTIFSMDNTQPQGRDPLENPIRKEPLP
jgi:cell division protein FtsL